MEDEIEQAVKAASEQLKAADAGGKGATDDAGAAAAAVVADAGDKAADKGAATVVEATEEEKTVAKAKDGESEDARVARLEAEGRDRSGRFKAKADGDKTVAAKGAAKDAGAKDDGKALVPPAHWDAEAKAAFVQAPRALQQQALKREAQIEEARKDWHGKAEDHNKMMKVIAPKLNDWAAAGITPDVAVGRLLAFETILKTNPTDGVVRVLSNFARGNEMAVIAKIAEANGFTLTKTGTQAGSDNKGNPPAQDEATARELKELRTKLADMERKDTERANAVNQADDTRIKSDIDAVAKDPKNLYFNNLIPEIRAILTIGDQEGDRREIKVRAQEAYDKAVWANTDTRKLVQEQQDRERIETARKAEADRVAAAKKAAVSIAGGAPGDGAQAQSQRTPDTNSIEDDVRAARQSLVTSRA